MYLILIRFFLKKRLDFRRILTYLYDINIERFLSKKYTLSVKN